MNKTTLIIDPEFEKLLAPLQPIELEFLEKSILRDGCRDPITIWGKTIVDGHNRYRICMNHQIPFSTVSISFAGREEAIAWICANQLGRRNLPEETRKYLIGKRYEMEKILGAHNAYGSNQYSHKEDRSKKMTHPVEYEDKAIRTRERLGKEYNISHGTVTKYNMFSTAIDKIQRVSPELSKEVLNGGVKISQENTVELAKLPTGQIKELSKQILAGKQSPVKYLNERRRVSKEHQEKRGIPDVSVKQMPRYDPDADFTSISFTIPSWIESISRVERTVDYRKVSRTAAEHLIKELSTLILAAEEMKEKIKEQFNGRL